MTSENPQLMPIEWNRAFIRSGFYFQKIENGFDFSQDNRGNQKFLSLILVRVGQQQNFKDSVFSPSSTSVDETVWLAGIEEIHSGSEGGPSAMQHIQLEIMDTYMAGIIRWINATGFKTRFSCDGHMNREPKLTLIDENMVSLLDFCFRAVSNGQWRYTPNRLFVSGNPPVRDASTLQPYDRAWLLDVAETLHQRQALIRELVAASERLLKSSAL